MKELQIERYDSSMSGEWDAFVGEARNATFLFSRPYMDYHSSRFQDCSLIVREEGKPLALLPANLDETVDESGRMVRTLRSHGGLTYGGWILPRRHVDAAGVLRIFSLMREFALENGISEIDYKPLPSIYASIPSADDRYALFRSGAVLTECNISCAINLADNPGFNTQQRRNLKRGLRAGAEIVELTSAAPLWELLTECLEERHGAAPVHTLEEMELLRRRFPEQIRLFGVEAAGELQAGVCIYDTGRVAHTQYICSTERGRRDGLLTLLFDNLINKEFAARAYFDFGTSNESHGLILNEGLYRQKFSLGGGGVAYERYRIPITETETPNLITD